MKIIISILVALFLSIPFFAQEKRLHQEVSQNRKLLPFDFVSISSVNSWNIHTKSNKNRDGYPLGHLYIMYQCEQQIISFPMSMEEDFEADLVEDFNVENVQVLAPRSIWTESNWSTMRISKKAFKNLNIGKNEYDWDIALDLDTVQLTINAEEAPTGTLELLNHKWEAFQQYQAQSFPHQIDFNTIPYDFCYLMFRSEKKSELIGTVHKVKPK